ETKTQYSSSGNHAQFAPEPGLSTPTKTHYPSTITHDQHFPLPQQSSETKTQYSSSGNHAQFAPEPGATKTQYPSSGSHAQYAPEPGLSTPTKTHFPSTIITHDQHFPLPQQSSETKTQYPSSGSHAQYAPEPGLSTPTKTHYPSTMTHDQHFPLPQKSSATKTQYPSSGSHDQFLPELSTQTKTPQTYTTTNPVEEPHYKPMEEPSKKSTYTDKISSATSAIADKAVTAKNAVASKLGYGDDNNNNVGTDNKTTQTKHDEENNKPSTVSSATSAIADKAVSAKNTIASKIGLGDTENKNDHAASPPREYRKSVAESLKEKLAVAGVGSGGTEMEQDKGVSAREYLVEKMRPSEEDRVLSEVISETLHKEEDEDDEGEKRMGKVTESEEVKRRLGGEDVKTEKKYGKMYANSPGEGVLDKVKGMVGSWLTEENQSS
ncbi:Low-temperature-induced 65 kDa protein, partial [Mucuna pruriens]